MLEKQTSSSSVVVVGVGAYSHSFLQTAKDNRAKVYGYLSRTWGHWAPRSIAPCQTIEECPNPIEWFREIKPTLIIPQSIDWAQQPWGKQLVDEKFPVFCPSGEALSLERSRDLARILCGDLQIPFPKARVCTNRATAKSFVAQENCGYVIKNPICGPTSPIHTICCESAAETIAWLDLVDDSEGIFLQEYLGREEVGHIALVSDGHIQPLITNQEYKRAYVGDQGPVAGAPLGGLVQADLEDRYQLCAQLITPLKPWFEKVGYRGPVQVTAAWHKGAWYVLEYNVRIGVSSGPLLFRMLTNPLEVYESTLAGQLVQPVFKPGVTAGAIVTKVGRGYPYSDHVRGPDLPLTVASNIESDIWWNEAEQRGDTMWATGHRVCEVCAIGSSIEEARDLALSDAAKINVPGGYHRTDIGFSLWPPRQGG